MHSVDDVGGVWGIELQTERIWGKTSEDERSSSSILLETNEESLLRRNSYDVIYGFHMWCPALAFGIGRAFVLHNVTWLRD